MSEREVQPLRPAHGAPDAVVQVPGSRSLTNRALVCAALATGESRLEGWLDADDTRAMREGLDRLGVQITERDGAIGVKGTGGRFAIPLHPLDCGASGTTMRLLAACSARVPGKVVLDGTSRMRERPIQELADALHQMGTRATTTAGCPPLTVQGGTLRGGQIGVDASRSSQFLSALLILAPGCPEEVTISTGEIASRPYVDMTLEVMNAFGVQVQQHSPHRFVVPAPQSYRARTYRIEPDASSATYFFAAAAITGGRIRVEGLTPASWQPDARFVEVLERMGCKVERGTTATTVRGPRYLHGIDVDMNPMPDAALTLAVTACFAQGKTRIRNVPNLRLKESDRMLALQNELHKLGAHVTVTETDLEISPPAQVEPARIATYDDHRIAMSFAIAGLRTPGIVIEDPECVSKTFPRFFEQLEELD